MGTRAPERKRLELVSPESQRKLSDRNNGNRKKNNACDIIDITLYWRLKDLGDRFPAYESGPLPS